MSPMLYMNSIYNQGAVMYLAASVSSGSGQHQQALTIDIVQGIKIIKSVYETCAVLSTVSLWTLKFSYLTKEK